MNGKKFCRSILVSWFLALGLFFAGCEDGGDDGGGGGPSGPACVDLDRDSYGANCALGDDCDDTDAQIHENCSRTWLPIFSGFAPSARTEHSAVWTGSVMVVWGGQDRNMFFADGARYDPLTDSWAAVSSIDAPSARGAHSAIWTGSRMLVWGGYNDIPVTTYPAGGAKYDPSLDSWTVMGGSPPEGRKWHSAIWTGSEMIVWGGHNGVNLDSGGRYNLAGDSWTATNATLAPAARREHTAVWDGNTLNEMIVWGGYAQMGTTTTGARYNIAGNSWTEMVVNGATTNTPAKRSRHAAFWVPGKGMLIWGGYDGGGLQSGGIYDPGVDKWTSTSLAGAPSGRWGFSAVWIPGLMVVWGGESQGSFYRPHYNDGAGYNPVTNTWTALSTTDAPSARSDATAVWTGATVDQIIFFGGSDANEKALGSGGCLNRKSNTWSAPSVNGAPPAISGQSAVWTGTQMIVWGGLGATYYSTGYIYNAATDSWSPLPHLNAPSPRNKHSAVWTGSQMIIWGGYDGAYLNTGEVYNALTRNWSGMNATGVPAAREGHIAVWAGGKMVIWGGFDGAHLNTGAEYSSGGWSAITLPLTGRRGHSAVSTGTDMMVWGGYDGSNYLADGVIYTVSTKTSQALPIINAPSGRTDHSAVWTGTQMIIWGGEDGSTPFLNSGAIYNPSGNAWTQIMDASPPEGRINHSSLWTGTQMIVWGGVNSAGIFLNSGGIYDPATDVWAETSISPLAGRRFHTAVWAGSKMVIFGGENGAPLGDGAKYWP